MNYADAADILTAIAAYDLRTVGDSDVIAWHAAIGELPKDLALEAVVIHHKTSAERIKPAHVLGIAKSIRRERAEREDAQHREARQAAHDRRNGLTGPDPQLGGLPIAADGEPVPGAYEQGTHGPAIDRICEHCGAQPMEPCTNPITGNPRKAPCLVRLTRKGALV